MNLANQSEKPARVVELVSRDIRASYNPGKQYPANSEKYGNNSSSVWNAIVVSLGINAQLHTSEQLIASNRVEHLDFKDESSSVGTDLPMIEFSITHLAVVHELEV